MIDTFFQLLIISTNAVQVSFAIQLYCSQVHFKLFFLNILNKKIICFDKKIEDFFLQILREEFNLQTNIVLKTLGRFRI